MQKFSDRTNSFSQSTIDLMTAICFEHHSLMLAAGTPGFDAPEELKEIACEYIRRGHNQYTLNRGSRRLRNAISAKWKDSIGREIDPENEITVVCGATEALFATAMATVNAGDPVVVFEPFYENYRSIALLAGGKPIFVPLVPPNWEPDWKALESAANGAKLIIVNSPHNPTGAVFSENTLQKIARIAVENDLFVISDETYRTMVYDDVDLCSIASFSGVGERTAVIGSFSKNMTATGWRVGYVIADEKFTEQVRKVHDFMSICAPAPFQDAIAQFWMSDKYQAYFNRLMSEYRTKRDILSDALQKYGFKFSIPNGTYYILADFSDIHPDMDDLQMVRYMAEEVGVCAVGGRAFFNDKNRAGKFIRFSFSRKLKEIEEAAKRLSNSCPM